MVHDSDSAHIMCEAKIRRTTKDPATDDGESVAAGCWHQLSTSCSAADRRKRDRGIRDYLRGSISCQRRASQAARCWHSPRQKVEGYVTPRFGAIRGGQLVDFQTVPLRLDQI